MIRTVRACPQCGLLVLHNCYHGDQDQRPVDMPADDAHELRERHVADLEAEIARYRDPRLNGD